jgi:hypothetical protein
MGLASRVRPRLDTAVVCAVSLVCVALYLAAAVAGYFPRPDYGVGFSPHTGAIRTIAAGGSAAAAGVSAGDRLVDIPHGNGERGYRLWSPRLGDVVHVATSHGVVEVVASERPASVPLALASTVSLLSSVAVCLFAVLLCIRRPGAMSLAFWFFSLGIYVPGIDPLGVLLPPPLTAVLVSILNGFSVFMAGLVLIPFALRFPSGTLRAGLQPFERIVWAACAAAFVFSLSYGNALLFGGAVDDRTAAWIFAGLSSAPLPIAAGILIFKYMRSTPVERAKTAWAIAGFGGAMAATALVWVIYLVFNGSSDTIAFKAIEAFIGAFISLFPLLAIYPIVRYQLFDLGFVVNRAALYSTLTIAAIATLAGINWLAQHFVTERLALVLQPIAAIVIGLGYLRVRESTQRLIERTIFRRRFAAEQRFSEMIGSFATVDSPEALDGALTTGVRDALALRAAAVFRRENTGYVLARSDGWQTPAVSIAEADLVGQTFSEPNAGAIDVVRDALGANFPAPPDEFVAAFALRSGTALTGFVLYGRHVNGTEIDPEELELLRGLSGAAGAAYHVAALQAELVRLRDENATLRHRSSTPMIPEG